jgi:hypothetical protein
VADNEITAMQVVADALQDLDPDARERVLRWNAERFQIQLAGPPLNVSRGQTGVLDAREVPSDPTFRDFVDLFDAATPRTDVDKALVGAYWLQMVQGSQSWASQSVNNLLKDTGNGLSNVTASLSKAQTKKPALVRQVSKSGRTAQARKQYKLTTAGIAAVRSAFTGATQEAEDDS